MNQHINTDGLAKWLTINTEPFMNRSHDLEVRISYHVDDGMIQMTVFLALRYNLHIGKCDKL
jgi:hypothetical protein